MRRKERNRDWPICYLGWRSGHIVRNTVSNELVDVHIFVSFYSLPFLFFSLFLLNCFILMFDFLVTLWGWRGLRHLLWLSIQVMSILLFRDWAIEGRECF